MMSNLIKPDSFHPDNGKNEMPIVIIRRLFCVSRTWDQARRQLKNCFSYILSYIFRLFIISIALTLGFLFAILYCKLQPCSHFCRSYFADYTSCSILQDTYLMHSSRSLKSVNSNIDATNKPSYAPSRTGANAWYENARTAARDLGNSNCYVCSKANPEQVIVGYPISGFPLTEGLEKIGGDNALFKDTLQLTLSPLDCLLRHTHTPTNPETPLGELLKLSNDTAGTCAPMKRPKNRLKPSLPLGQIPLHFNTSMICLRRLKLTGPDTHIDYTKDNYTFFSDSPGARCNETWLAVSVAEVVSYLEEHTHSSSSSRESIIVPPDGVLNDTDWGELVKSHMVTRLTRPIPHAYWLCNNTLRLALPVTWTGTCGLVTVDVCCTFIPNNTAPNGSFTQAMNKLEALQIELIANTGHGQWLDRWLQDTFGRWKELIVAFVTVAACF
ncbi:uncharacterized protein LOC113022935 [Astatotilapia calliptera]|uniref:uncharacterized protein LOC113022935 n=1 Tax=Astatotilapia calliptera TaxID=8154 RepID=UPI000E4205F6|nr:uncharacterized protein LOC113022935 [Astatotilapia calliptera]XP_026024671.1 uncharacterized protein LOC113022935 [Astatotilapia calliptera]